MVSNQIAVSLLEERARALEKPAPLVDTRPAPSLTLAVLSSGALSSAVVMTLLHRAYAAVSRRERARSAVASLIAAAGAAVVLRQLLRCRENSAQTCTDYQELRRALQCEAATLLERLKCSAGRRSVETQTDAIATIVATRAPTPSPMTGGLVPPPIGVGAPPPPPPPPLPQLQAPRAPRAPQLPTAADLAGGLSKLRSAAASTTRLPVAEERRAASTLPGARLAGGFAISLDDLSGVKLRNASGDAEGRAAPEKPKEMTPEGVRARRKLKTSGAPRAAATAAVAAKEFGPAHLDAAPARNNTKENGTVQGKAVAACAGSGCAIKVPSPLKRGLSARVASRDEHAHEPVVGEHSAEIREIRRQEHEDPGREQGPRRDGVHARGSWITWVRGTAGGLSMSL
jgi:hypothetical protein